MPLCPAGLHIKTIGHIGGVSNKEAMLQLICMMAIMIWVSMKQKININYWSIKFWMHTIRMFLFCYRIKKYVLYSVFKATGISIGFWLCSITIYIRRNTVKNKLQERFLNTVLFCDIWLGNNQTKPYISWCQ